jgi:putative ABC transport system permease protein
MIRQTIRSLLKSPGFTAASIVALALGIGANTAIFSLVNTVLLRPLPYKDPGRLVMLWQRAPVGGNTNDASAADFQDWRDRSRSFEQLSAVLGSSFNLTEGDQPERISGLHVTASFFTTLGVMPALGGVFGSEEEQPGAQRSVVLSDTLWRRRFGGNRGLIGQTIHLDRQAYTVVGVMPPGFEFFGRDNELWAPLPLEPNRTLRNYYNLQALARLKPGVTIRQARAEMDTIARQLALEYPKTNQGWGTAVAPLQDEITGNVRLPLLVLLAAVAFVLLIACANVANLLLARAAGRQKEFAIRAALGAGRLDFVRRLLAESMSLALAGGALGVVLARWSISALVTLHPQDIPRLQEVGVDWRVLAFTAAVSLLTGILFGLAPAAQVSKLDLNEALNEGGRGATEGRRGGRTRSLLVIAEMALALVLLIGATLMIRTFVALEQASTGFPTENLLTMNVMIPEQQYSNEQQVADTFERVIERIRSIPGVYSAASATNLPAGGWNQGRAFTIAGRAPKSAGEIQGAGFLSVSPGYFHTIGLTLRRGREFTAQDRHGAPDVVIISESMARRYWPAQNPLGKRIICASVQFGKRGLGPPLPREIVGIVGDVQHVGRDAETSVEMYVPQLQNTIPFTFFVVRTSGDAARLAPAVTRGVNEVLKDLPVSGVKTIDDRLAESFSRPRFQMLLLGAFAGLALLLATLGIYGVMAYSVTQRAHEIGIRMALGADAGQVLRLMLGHGLKLALIGVALGLAGAFASTRLMTTLLYGVTPTDAATFACVSALLITVAALASFVPAWRAAKTDPVSTLRSQL